MADPWSFVGTNILGISIIPEINGYCQEELILVVDSLLRGPSEIVCGRDLSVNGHSFHAFPCNSVQGEDVPSTWGRRRGLIEEGDTGRRFFLQKSQHSHSVVSDAMCHKGFITSTLYRQQDHGLTGLRLVPPARSRMCCQRPL
jgi:hypothetical protein